MPSSKRTYLMRLGVVLGISSWLAAGPARAQSGADGDVHALTPPAIPSTDPSHVGSTGGAVTAPAATVRAALGLVIVIYTDGSEVRGLALELASGSHVLIRLANGEERRIPWASIRTLVPVAALPAQGQPTTAESEPVAGHAENRDGASPALGTASTGAAPPTFFIESDEPNLELRIRTGSHVVGHLARTTVYQGSYPHARTTLTPLTVVDYETVCVAPCTTPKRFTGREEFMVVSPRLRPGSSNLRIRSVRIRIPPDAIGLRIGLVDHTRRRRIAWAGYATVPVIGGALIGLAFAHRDSSRSGVSADQPNERLYWTGFALALSPSLSIVWPLFTRHQSRVTVIRSGDRRGG